MKTKLLPPFIDGKIAAQVGDVLRIPYQHNKAVGINDFDSMSLKIKTISTNLDIAILEGDKKGNFRYAGNKLIIGQYYKAQLAYVSEGETGVYSSVGVFKYTGLPKLFITSGGQVFETNKKNHCSQQLIGNYSAPADDPNEKAYSYCFNIYENDDILVTSGELLHKSSLDENNGISSDVFKFNELLSSKNQYSVQYIVTTLNGLKIASPRYLIAAMEQVELDFGFELLARNNFENGYISISLLPNKTYILQGKFGLFRESVSNGRPLRERVKDFIINDTLTNGVEYYLFKDFTTTHGTEVTYSLQQYDDNELYSTPIKSLSIYSDFEDIFLYDGERQLKVQFNPKISSFKETLLESKIDTIGGQFPFFFRNGNTKYKEFPISGLISYHADNELLFIEHEDYQTNLTGDNLAEERDFKLAVMNWLNNGKPKLFRSPAEGNCIVRLMNVSLSPEDTLGRMLHSFNCNAYEIATYSYDSLISMNFLGGEKSLNKSLSLYRIDKLEPRKEYPIPSAVWARLYGAYGTTYTLTFADGSQMSCRMGNAGIYETKFYNNPLVSISYPELLGEIVEHSIEYLSERVNAPGLVKDGHTIKSIEYIEKCDMYNGIVELIEQINSTNELSNILVLRLSNTRELNDTTETKVYFAFEDGDVKGFDLSNQTIVNEDGSTSFLTGGLELTARDFDGIFCPSMIALPEYVRADIYYRLEHLVYW